jgi:small subunit ribosomal protein S13
LAGFYPKMAEAKQELKYFVRIANTDLDGKKSIMEALRKIKGIDVMVANAICTIAGIDKAQKAGYLSDAHVKKLDEVVTNPTKFNLPTWLLNRRKDKEDGTNKHVITSNLIFVMDNDIKMLKKMRCYRGVRHSLGQPVRGQRTKSNFRKNKGKVMGVKKGGSQPAPKPAAK